jgi:flagellar hook-associated protein 3 FlgL
MGTSTAITEHAALDRVDAYTRATDAVGSRLVLADTVLSDIVTQLTAAQSAALSARGTTTTPAQRTAVAAELLSIRDAIMSDINTQLHGTYLFSGSNVLVAPYAVVAGSISAYQGDNSAVVADVAAGRDVAGTFDGGAILQGADGQHILDGLTDLADAITAGDANAITAGVAAVERAFDRATLAQTRIGNDLRALDTVRVQLTTAHGTSVARLSAVEDADLAAVSARLAQSETAYRAALASIANTLKLSLFDFMK